MTKSVVMLANVFDADRVLLAAGSTVSVADSVADDLIGTRRARWESDPVGSPTPTALAVAATIAQVKASNPPIKAGVMLADPVTGVLYGQADGAGGWRPFNSARMHRDIRALLNAATTNVSIHAASGIVSNAAGRLFGFIVMNPGASTPTMTVYDNASAASGRVLKSVAAAELSAGAWLDCGPDGVPAANGIYVALGGGTAPVVLAVFEGAVPAASHSGTEMWFDGTLGSDSNNGLSIGAPRKTLSRSAGDFDSGNWRLYLKRGTVVQMRVTDAHDCAGTDVLVRDYGDTSLAKPIIEYVEPTSPESFTITNAGSGYTDGVHTGLAAVGGSGTGLLLTITVAGGVVTACTRHTRGTGYAMGDAITCSTIPGGGSAFACTPLVIGCGNFASTATSGVFEQINVDVRYTGSIQNAGLGAVSCARGARMLASNVDVWSTSAARFNTGFGIAGDGSRLLDCRVLASNVGGSSAGNAFFAGSSARPSPNYLVVHRCTSAEGAAESDALTLHDGNVLGTCNAVVGGELHAGIENCFDSLGGYDKSLLFGVRCVQGQSYAVSISQAVNGGTGGVTGGAGPMLIANEIVQGDVQYGVVLNRHASPVIVGNYIEGAPTNGGAVLGLQSTCTGSLVLHNTIKLGAAANGNAAFNAAANGVAGSSGTFRNNLILDDSTAGATGHTMFFYDATNFAAWTVDSNYYRAPSPRWDDGPTVHTTFGAWDATAASDYGHSATDPVMTNGYELPTNSPLIGAGVKQTPVYVGLSGVMFPHGGPTIGCDERLWEVG